MANRLQLFSPEVSFASVGAAVPFNEGPTSNIDQENADFVCQALVKLLQGHPVSIDVLPDASDPRARADIPPTQPEAAIAELKVEETHALTQVANRNPGASQEEPPTKRLRDEPLSARDLQGHSEAMTKI